FARADEGPELKSADKVELTRGDNKELEFQFNFGRTYVVALNMKLPQSDVIKKALLDMLGKKQEFRDTILFHPFAPDKVPDLVEVTIGRKVPREAVQGILTTLNGVPGLKLVLSIMVDDGSFGDTQRVYIGSLTASGKKPIAAEKLKALLNPKLTHRELL